MLSKLFVARLSVVHFGNWVVGVVTWAGCHNWCRMAAGRGIAADIGVMAGSEAAERDAANIGRRCGSQEVGSGLGWSRVDIAVNIEVIVDIAHFAAKHVQAGHAAANSIRPLQLKAAAVDNVDMIIAVSPEHTGVTVDISGYVGFADVDCINVAAYFGSRPPSAATGNTGCTVGRGDFSVDTS